MKATYTSLPLGEIAIHGLSVNEIPRARRKSCRPVQVRPWSRDLANVTSHWFIHAA